MTRRPETLLVMAPDTMRLQFGEAELARLRATARLGEPVCAGELASAPVRARLAEVEVLITSWGCPPLDDTILRAAPNLRAVLHAAGSVRDHVGAAVFVRGLLVTTAAGANAEPVAQYTLGAILWAFKKVPFLAADARTVREDWRYRDGRGELSGRPGRSRQARPCDPGRTAHKGRPGRDSPPGTSGRRRPGRAPA